MLSSEIDWARVAADLDDRGFAHLPTLLSPSTCLQVGSMYDDEQRFRSRIDMERFRFGVGEYKYFADPLPDVVRQLRESLYGHLAPIANVWAARLKIRATSVDTSWPKTRATSNRSASLQASGFPPTLADFRTRCHRAGQRRPTPLLLRYGAGGYNCLHQDLYGEIAFPLQVVFLLSKPEIDFTGGAFLLVEQRPRAQSRGHAIRIDQGAGLVFAVRERPVAGARGEYRTAMRHGVSTILTGQRMSLGIIFHDAK